MKRIALFILLLFLVCGCAEMQKNEVSEVAQGQTISIDDEKGYALKSFDYYHNEGSIFNTFAFLKNPFEEKETALYPGYNEIPDQNLFSLSAFSRGFYPNEQCSDAIAFLCDEEAIRKCFLGNGIENIREIIILSLMDERTGYVIAALTENEAYYMTVPIAEAEYGDYIYQKVYTSEEFKKIYSPREAEVYIDGKKMNFPSVTLLGEEYVEMDMLGFFEALGYECKYDSEKQEITAGEYKIKLSYNEERTRSREEYADFIESAPVYDVTSSELFGSSDMGRAVLKDGRFLANARVIEGICNVLGYEIDYRYDDMSIHIFKE